MLDEVGGDRLHRGHRRARIHGERAVERVAGDLEQRAVGHHPGAIHEHVQTPERVQGRGHERPSLFEVGEIDHVRGDAVGRECRGAREAVFSDVRRENLRPLVEENLPKLGRVALLLE